MTGMDLARRMPCVGKESRSRVRLAPQLPPCSKCLTSCQIGGLNTAPRAMDYDRLEDSFDDLRLSGVPEPARIATSRGRSGSTAAKLALGSLRCQWQRAENRPYPLTILEYYACRFVSTVRGHQLRRVRHPRIAPWGATENVKIRDTVARNGALARWQALRATAFRCLEARVHRPTSRQISYRHAAKPARHGAASVPRR
jgi:hypothetical protein